jgi:hypothetical protein
MPAGYVVRDANGLGVRRIRDEADALAPELIEPRRGSLLVSMILIIGRLQAGRAQVRR